MAKKLTIRQESAVRRVANRLGISDQLVRTIVLEYLDETTQPPKRKTAKK